MRPCNSRIRLGFLSVIRSEDEEGRVVKKHRLHLLRLEVLCAMTTFASEVLNGTSYSFLNLSGVIDQCSQFVNRLLNGGAIMSHLEEAGLDIFKFIPVKFNTDICVIAVILK